MRNEFDFLIKEKNWKVFYIDAFVILGDIKEKQAIKLNFSSFNKFMEFVQKENYLSLKDNLKAYRG